MIKTVFRLDDERITADGEYDKDKLYEEIEGICERKNLAFSRDSEGRFEYCGMGKSTDFSYVWLVNMSLKNRDWFRKYVIEWRYYEIDDEEEPLEIQYEEDLIAGGFRDAE